MTMPNDGVAGANAERSAGRPALRGRTSSCPVEGLPLRFDLAVGRLMRIARGLPDPAGNPGNLL
jgi:hypothetical protein